MPTVTKQPVGKPANPSMKGANSRKLSILDRIEDIAEDQDGIKLSVYGVSKTGKTRLACSFPKPMLLIGTEKGTKSVVGIAGVKFVLIRHSDELQQLVDHLTESEYKSVALDTAGGLQDLITKEVLGLNEIPIQRSWGIAKQQDWGVIGGQCKERLSKLLNLSEIRGIHVTIIAHERNFKQEGDSDIMLASVGSALTPSVAGWLNGACDYICQTYKRPKTIVREVTVGEGKTAVVEKIEEVVKGADYCLRVGPHPVYMTGFRQREGIVLPDSIVNPTYEKIAKLIRGK